MVRHTSIKLLVLLNHSFWGVHIAGRKQSFISWGVHITGRNWAFSSAVEKLSRHCPGTEYQHKGGHTSNILCRIHKNFHCQCCIAMTAPNGKTTDRWLSYQPPIASEPYPTITVLTGNCPRNYPTGPTQIVLFEPPGEISTPERRVLAIKQSIEELKHLTHFTDFIIVHGVQCSQCRNLQGHWIQATYAINAAIPRESCENQWVCSTWTECSRPWMG